MLLSAFGGLNVTALAADPTVNIVATKMMKSGVTLYWEKLSDVTGCEIEYSFNKDMSNSKTEKIEKTSRHYRIKSENHNTIYYRTRAYLVKNGVISLEQLIELMSTNPRKRFKISTDIGFSVFDVTNPYIINPNGFKTKGRATPFSGISVFGRCKATVYNQKVIYQY